MSKMIFFSFLIAFSARADQLIVWNVGQGQWVSEIHPDYCLHFDMGGERSPLPQVLKICGEKMNYVHLSHWDLDHISFIRIFSRSARKSCLMEPSSEAPSPSKKKLIERIALCNPQQVNFLRSQMSILHRPLHVRTANETSEVVFSKQFATVIPGDSPKSQEKIWAEVAPSGTRGLILGHHGSRTSTSDQLLKSLPHLQWAVATARKKRYGHPHREVIEALKKEKVPLLKTEDWGHLHFLKNELTDNY